MAILPATTILCDLDGTLYTGSATVPGAVDALRQLRDLGCRVVFLTNTDSKPEAMLLASLRARGFDVDAAELFTPVSAALRLLAGLPQARVVPFMSGLLADVFTPFAATPADEISRSITHVIVGDPRGGLDYAALDAAFRAIRNGAELIALQRGRYFKDRDGDHIDTGALVAALEYSTGVSARLLGKPSLDFLTLAAESAGVRPQDVWVVGDDATSDIAMGNAAGAVTVQVETGKYPDQAAERQVLLHRATHQITSIVELPALIAARGA